MSAASSAPPVRFHTRAGVAFATLDRPQALNALNLEVIDLLRQQLPVWAGVPDLRVVVLRGTGERAFCAGGDVRALCPIRDQHPEWRDFFRREYQLIWEIHRFPKPVVAVLDGITMGGGMGLAWAATHRVLTERARLAMPEAAIGLFPDVGATHFLPRLPGAGGVYLGLTGLSLEASDALAVGLADRLVPAARLPSLYDSLEKIGSDAFTAVAAAIDREAVSPAPGWWTRHAAEVEECFTRSSLEAVVNALDRCSSSWAAAAARSIRANSPTSLRVCWRQLQRGRRQRLDEALRSEFRLVQRMAERPDFCEGVRARLVDRDRNPVWSPATLEEVSEEAVAALHEPVGVEELALARPQGV